MFTKARVILYSVAIAMGGLAAVVHLSKPPPPISHTCVTGGNWLARGYSQVIRSERKIPEFVVSADNHIKQCSGGEWLTMDCDPLEWIRLLSDDSSSFVPLAWCPVPHVGGYRVVVGVRHDHEIRVLRDYLQGRVVKIDLELMWDRLKESELQEELAECSHILGRSIRYKAAVRRE